MLSFRIRLSLSLIKNDLFYSSIKPDVTFCQWRYYASKAKSTQKPVFDRVSKRLQKCRAASSSDVSVFEYLKEEVRNFSDNKL